MACFLIPAGEAVVTTIAEKVIRAKESSAVTALEDNTAAERHPFSTKLKWLNNMLWGGSALLLFEHIWHGEVVPWFPFLTAAADPADTAEMLTEMSTVGVAMSLAVTGVWALMVTAASVIEKRKAAKESGTESEGAA